MAITKITYANSTTIDCTLASLANSSTLGRGSIVVDNSGNNYDDALLQIAIKASGTTLGGDKVVYVFLYGSEDGSNYNAASSEAVGADVSININQPSNLKGPIVISAQGTNQTFGGVYAVASFFGGTLPRKWGFVLRNATGQNLDPTESSHRKTYTGITYTVA